MRPTWIYLYFLKAKAIEILPLIYQRRLTGDILQCGYNQSIITNAISTRRRRELTQSESQKIVDVDRKRLCLPNC